MTELTLPCAFVRKRGLASPRFPLYTYIYVYISVYSGPSFISRLRIKLPISILAGVSWTFRFYFHDTALTISQS